MSKKSRDKTIARAAQALALVAGKPEPPYQWALNQAREMLAAGDARPAHEIAADIAARARSEET